MEQSGNIIQRFSGLIRLAVFIIFVLALLILTIRWISNRRATQRAEQAVKTAVKPDEAQKSKEDGDQKSGVAEKSQPDNSPVEVTIPSGISEESEVDDKSSATSVPNAGIEDVVMPTFMISIIVYLFVLNSNLKKTVNKF